MLEPRGGAHTRRWWGWSVGERLQRRTWDVLLGGQVRPYWRGSYTSRRGHCALTYGQRGAVIHPVHLMGPDPELERRNHNWSLSRSLGDLWREGRKKRRRNRLQETGPVEQRAAWAGGLSPQTVISQTWGRVTGCRPGAAVQKHQMLGFIYAFHFSTWNFHLFCICFKVLSKLYTPG